MTSVQILNSHNLCEKRTIYERNWEKRLMSSIEGLYRSIEAGLTSTEEDASQIAYDHFMEIAVSRGFDIPQTDMLGHAQHHSSLAEMLVYVLREKDRWERPLNVQDWTSSAFLSPDGKILRRIHLVDGWSEQKLLALGNSWEVMGETAMYDVPIDVYVISLGTSREGRRHGYFSKGITHPVSKGLRFQKRDGTDFVKGWESIFREDSGFDKSEWLDMMVEDEVLTSCLQIVRYEPPKELKKVREIISRTLSNASSVTEADPKFAICNLTANPCPFRSCCPYFREPSIEGGFIERP